MNRLTLLCLCAIGIILSTPANADDLDEQALRQALSGPEREVADRIRDADRRPVEVLQFLQVEPGMTVLDVYAAGGYFTWILSHAVGMEGLVYAQNSPRALRYDQDRSDITQGDALAQKLENGALDNVRRIDRPVRDTGLPPSSVDFVLVSQILHDYHNRSPARGIQLLETLYGLLKPGGILGIIDHSGIAGADNSRLHRMLEADARKAAEAAGFIVEADSDLLAQPQDNPRRSIFDPMLGRKTDQFLLRLRKPD
jgi:predicted methyltransferase